MSELSGSGISNSSDSLNIIVADRYKLIRQIGWGSFGEVYEGVDIISRNRVAVKLEEL